MLTEKVLNNVELEMAFHEKRNPCEVIYTVLPEEYASIITMFERKNHIIIVNQEQAQKLSDGELIASVIHEGRHAYQWEQINHMNQSKEAIERIKRWKYEFENYNQPKQENSKEYITQEIEIDAIAYTRIYLEKVMKLKLAIPKEIKLIVEKRMIEIQKK